MPAIYLFKICCFGFGGKGNNNLIWFAGFKGTKPFSFFYFCLSAWTLFFSSRNWLFLLQFLFSHFVGQFDYCDLMHSQNGYCVSIVIILGIISSFMFSIARISFDQIELIVVIIRIDMETLCVRNNEFSFPHGTGHAERFALRKQNKKDNLSRWESFQRLKNPLTFISTKS